MANLKMSKRKYTKSDALEFKKHEWRDKYKELLLADGVKFDMDTFMQNISKMH
jgi:hypothetical protein